MLGVADNAIAAYETFSGQSVSTTDILVKFTYLGDANLDGLVNPDDFISFVNGFSGGSAVWFWGDYNYNGFVNPDDVTAFVNGMGSFSGGGGQMV